MIFNKILIENDHILIEATNEESRRDLVEIDRIEDYFKKIQNNVTLQVLDKPSPLSVPLLIEINSEYLDKSKMEEFYLRLFEEKLLTDVGLNEMD